MPRLGLPARPDIWGSSPRRSGYASPDRILETELQYRPNDPFELQPVWGMALRDVPSDRGGNYWQALKYAAQTGTAEPDPQRYMYTLPDATPKMDWGGMQRAVEQGKMSPEQLNRIKGAFDVATQQSSVDTFNQYLPSLWGAMGWDAPLGFRTTAPVYDWRAQNKITGY